MIPQQCVRLGQFAWQSLWARVTPTNPADWSWSALSWPAGDYAPDRAPADMIRWLQERKASGIPHVVGTFVEHLAGVGTVLRHWGQPAWLQHAGWLHSVYSTSGFARTLVPLRQREEVQSYIGERAEALVFLFASIDRRHLLETMAQHAVVPDAGIELRNRVTGEVRHFPGAAIAALLLLLAADGAHHSAHRLTLAPSRWLHRTSRIFRQVHPFYTVPSPLFDAGTVELSDTDERRALTAYRAGRYEEASTHNPWVAEPWLLSGDPHRAALGLVRLEAWGTPWDKRRSWDEWCALGQRLVNVDR